MKKRELEKLAEIEEEKKLNKEGKNIIAKKLLKNTLIALNVVLLFVIFIIASVSLSKERAIFIYKISSFVLLFFTILIFEIAYKKDNDKLAINGIEMMVISIVVLLTPYAFITKNAVTTIIVGCYIIALYYIVKNIVVYNQEKNKILLKQSDIPQIIKKESQDEMVKIEKERLSQLKQKEQPKRKRGRPKKV